MRRNSDYTLQELQAEMVRRFGMSTPNWAVQCPRCKRTLQHQTRKKTSNNATKATSRKASQPHTRQAIKLASANTPRKSTTMRIPLFERLWNNYTIRWAATWLFILVNLFSIAFLFAYSVALALEGAQ